MTAKELAKKMIDRSYSPYSHFAVGACLEFNDGNMVGGCNVENASYGMTICAERVAITSSIAQGLDLSKATALYLYTPTNNDIVPCGACLQFMLEFFDDIDIIVTNPTSTTKYTLNQLMPIRFDKKSLD